LPLLIRHFVEGFSLRYGKPGLRLSKRTEGLLSRHAWPGNIRELENALSYACMVTQSDTVDIGDLPAYLMENQSSDRPHLATLADVEYEYVMKVLKACDGNRARAADILGIARATLYRLISRQTAS
jgi:DNA-binding NtrC family response regulator